MPLKNLNIHTLVIILAVLLKIYWFYAEYTIETDNAMRMQYGIKWTQGEFNVAHLDFAPLLTAVYGIFYLINKELFLFFDLLMVLFLPLIEFKIFNKTVNIIFKEKSKSLKTLILLSMIFYTGYSFKYQINDVLVVYLFLAIWNYTMSDKFFKAGILIMIVPLLKYSAISTAFFPFIYLLLFNRNGKKMLISLTMLIVSISLYLLLTTSSHMDDKVNGFYLKGLYNIYKMDAFFLKLGVFEYFLISVNNKLSIILNYILDFQLFYRFIALAFVSVIFFDFKRNTKILSNSILFKTTLVATTIHVGYMLLLLLLVPPAPFPSSWTIGHDNDMRWLMEIPRYYSFLNIMWFLVFLEWLVHKSETLLKPLVILLSTGLLVSFNYSGYLFPFYNSVYKKYVSNSEKKLGKTHTHVYGDLNYEAWKVFYILDKKDPNERFKKE